MQAQSFATEKLWIWQQKMNLGDWKISVVVAPIGDLRPDTVGNVHWDLREKTAVIRILDPADYKLPFQAMLRDIEFTVVHELIHVEIAPIVGNLDRSPASHVEEERTANSVAGALLASQ